MLNRHSSWRGLLLGLVGILLAATTGRAQGGPPQPCRNEAESAQLNFWVGDWEVSNRADGRVVGSNRIEVLPGQCALLETYSTDRGYDGKSMSFYDPALGQWRQIYIDSAGTIMEFQGRLSEGSMRLEGESKRRDGLRAKLRMTYTPEADGSVRQLIEQSTDGGKSWTVSFDGRYVKRKS